MQIYFISKANFPISKKDISNLTSGIIDLKILKHIMVSISLYKFKKRKILWKSQIFNSQSYL